MKINVLGISQNMHQRKMGLILNNSQTIFVPVKMNIQISLPATQKPAPKAQVNVRQVAPGDIICEAAGFLRGHGTFIQEGNLIASVAGVVETVNKFVMVRPLRSRYAGEVGDVIVGRVNEVTPKSWKIETNAKQNSVLLLSSIELPGDVRRRRTTADALSMRNFFVENDLMSAEVQTFFGDGSMSLQTRNKYGKLDYGIVLEVPASLIKRSKTHFHVMDCGVQVIMANNGLIWISPSTVTDDDEPMDQEEKKPQMVTMTPELRLAMARVRNSITALVTTSKSIHGGTLLAVFNLSTSLGLHPKQMLDPNVILQLTSNI